MTALTWALNVVAVAGAAWAVTWGSIGWSAGRRAGVDPAKQQCCVGSSVRSDYPSSRDGNELELVLLPLPNAPGRAPNSAPRRSESPLSGATTTGRSAVVGG